VIKKFTAVFLGFFLIAGLYAEPVGKTNKDIKMIANPVLGNILNGMKTNDPVKFGRDFDDTMREACGGEKAAKTIKQIYDQVGNYKTYEYLGFLNTQGMTKILWKAKYDKTGDDVLITAVISKRNNKYLVTGLWFQ